jgi:hypothetical protein
VNCLDCVTDFRLQIAAVAVCTGCGAAVCGEHAQVREQTLTRLVPGGMAAMTVPVTPPARLVRCLRCDTAHVNGRP